MLRFVHRWPGLLAAVFLIVLSLSGTVLSVFPVLERFSSPQAEATLSVADLADRVQTAYPQVEQVRRAPSGRITAYWFEGGVPQAAVVDPATGRGIASADPNPIERWLTGLHRSLFLNDGGRIAMAAGAAALLALSVSGAVLAARRAGGWRRWFAPPRGPLTGRLYVEIARLTVAGLLFSSASALWMTASTFDLLPDGSTSPVLQAQASGRGGMSLMTMEPLQRTPVTQLRSLSFADPDDPADVLTLKTDKGAGYIDQGTGALLAWSDLTGWQHLSETIYMLHTGRGASTLGLVLDIMALGVPVMAGTGFVLWFAGWRWRPRIRDNASARQAQTILLVGSEPRRNQYSQHLASNARGERQAAIAVGHVPLREDGTIAGPSLDDQLEQVFLNMKGTLRAAGSDFSNVAWLTIYVRGLGASDLPIIRAARDPHIYRHRPPTSALIGVAELYDAHVRVEIDAIAVAA